MIRDCKRGPVCNFCGQKGHKSFDCPYAKEAKEKVKAKIPMNLRITMPRDLRQVYSTTARSQSLV
jgi:hypothetical protein